MEMAEGIEGALRSATEMGVESWAGVWLTMLMGVRYGILCRNSITHVPPNNLT